MSSRLKVTGWFDEVGKGWRPLLAELHDALTAVNPAYETAQVKEKFGWLSVYIEHDGDDPRFREMENIIQDFEERSSVICEWCGDPGETRPGGWYKTLCDTCQGKRQAGYRPWLEEKEGKC